MSRAKLTGFPLMITRSTTRSLWYLLYVICNNWARDFMDIKVVGNINIALVWGLLQFVSTFAIAYFYARHAKKSLDPLASELRDEFDRETGR